MKRYFLMLLTSFFSLLQVSITYGLNYGTNITIFDQQFDSNYQSTPTNMGYTGLGIGNEDQETEPGTARGEIWDLEGIFLDGTELSLVGQWDFVNGVNSGGKEYSSGDIFIKTGSSRPAPQSTDYEYVFDVDWLNATYKLYKINSGSFLSVTYRMESNYWRIDTVNSDLTAIASGSFSSLIDNSLGFYGSSNHNVVTGFDLYPILLDLGVNELEFYAHFTLSCGNDELEGHATAAPEPITLILLGLSLIGLGTLSSKKLKK